jgi:hypothetical protein
MIHTGIYFSNKDVLGTSVVDPDLEPDPQVSEALQDPDPELEVMDPAP